MLDILITFLTFVLILVSLFMVLVILMQRANANAGMGSAFGGGAAESAFGAETTNILTRATKWSALAFFLLSLTLYLLWLERADRAESSPDEALPGISATEQEENASPAADEAPSEADSEEGSETMESDTEETSSESNP